MTTFPGISPVIKNYNKTENAFFSRLVTVPLCQEKDIVCKPVVQEGQTVREGEVIAEPEMGSGKAKIHSPVPGKIIGFVSAKNPDGKPVVAVQIKLEGSFSYTGKKLIPSEWENFSPVFIESKLSDKGVVNTYDVLHPETLSCIIKTKREEKRKVLAVRLFDEDPVRVTDELVTKLYPEAVQTGARIVAKAMDAEEIIYFFGDKKTAEESLISKEYNTIEKTFVVNSEKYPASFKKELCMFYNKQNRKEKIQLSENDLFIDSSTLYDVYEAVVFDKPSIIKTVHFSGDAIPVKTLMHVRIGTTLRNIIDQIGGFVVPPSMIVINGHLTGYSVDSLDVPITKFVKSVSFVSKKRTPETLMYSCISCGNCRDICPRNLAPDLLYLYKVENYPLQKEFLLSASYCSECGLCNTVCPSRIPLTQVIGSLNETLMNEEVNK